MALSSHIVKTMERVVRKQVVSYSIENDLLESIQHGSRSGRSTLTQLLEQYNWLLDQLAEGHNTDLVFLDFSKPSIEWITLYYLENFQGLVLVDIS